MSKGNEFSDILKLKVAENPKKFHKMCELKLGKDKGPILSRNYELMMQCAIQQKPFPMEKFYGMIYSDIKVANTLYSLLDGEYLLKVYDYLERNQEHLGNTILVDGDTSGFVAAFLSYLLPEAKITCLAWCQPFCSYSLALFKKLNMPNIEVVLGKADRAEGPYDSIVLTRSLLQNMVDTPVRHYAFSPLPVLCEVMGERFKPYFACLASKAKEGGHIFDFEQDNGKPVCGAFMQFSKTGYDIFDTEDISFHTPYGDYHGTAAHFVGTKESTKEDAYIIWKNYYLETNPINGNMLEDVIADIALEDYHRELIGGYYFLNGDDQCGKIAMYRDALQYDKFLFYHSVQGHTALFVYDEKLLPEAKSKIEAYVSQYKESFTCVKIRQIDNRDCDPFEEVNEND